MAVSQGSLEASQDSPLLTDDLPEAIQKALAELAGRRREVEALKSAVGVRDDKIRILEQIIAQQTEIIEQWKTAATERAGANVFDSKLEASYKASVARYSVELAAVRIDRDKANRARKWWFATGLVLGVVAGVFAAK